MGSDSKQRLIVSTCVVLGTSLLAPVRGLAQSTTSQDDSLQEIVVSAPNLVGVVQERDSATTFGIDKPLIDTPRSVTALSDDLLDRYNIKTVYDFTAVAAGARVLRIDLLPSLRVTRVSGLRIGRCRWQSKG